MPKKVDTTSEFDKGVKRLKRKYRSVSVEVDRLKLQLEGDSRPGDRIPNTQGREVFKVRLPNRSARRGKSGGFRVIYYIRTQDSVILLLIYSKTEQDDISDDEIRRLLAELD